MVAFVTGLYDVLFWWVLLGRLAMSGSLLLLVMIHCLGLLCAFVAFFLFVVNGYCGCVYIRFGFVFRLLLLGMISAVWVLDVFGCELLGGVLLGFLVCVFGLLCCLICDFFAVLLFNGVVVMFFF